MGTREEELARIGKYVQENMDYFCSPPPEGLGLAQARRAPQVLPPQSRGVGTGPGKEWRL